MAAGTDIASASNPEYPNRFGETTEFTENYYYASGTSMASPLVAGVVANLVMEYPNLTPDQIESILKSSVEEFGTKTKCNTLGCGEGVLMADKATNSISDVTTLTDYKKEHRYSNHNTSEQETWLTEMNKFVNTCNLIHYSWGNLGSEMDNVTYKIYTSNSSGEMTYSETVTIPQYVHNVSEGVEIGVQACLGGDCGNILEMKGNVTKPNSCL